jgi:hypothetical protein
MLSGMKAPSRSGLGERLSSDTAWMGRKNISGSMVIPSSLETGTWSRDIQGCNRLEMSRTTQASQHMQQVPTYLLQVAQVPRQEMLIQFVSEVQMEFQAMLPPALAAATLSSFSIRDDYE